jgi:prepilin-type N-terminal cleavage/methylation domain-containing protein
MSEGAGLKQLRTRGFTLIEMAVVLAIAIILITMSLGAMNAQSSIQAYAATKKKQDLIADALRSYLRQNRRLPCPDSPDPAVTNSRNGRGDDNRATPGDPTTRCDFEVGIVPFVELGLSRESVIDGWDNFFTYHVTSSDPAAVPCRGWTIASCWNPGNVGLLGVGERTPATSATPNDLTAVDKAVVVLVSHGKNGLGAWTTLGSRIAAAAGGSDEAVNALTGPAARNFITREFTDAVVPTYGPFDDLVIYFTPNDLLNPLIKDGALTSADGTSSKAAEQVASIKTGDFLAQSTAGDMPATGFVASAKDGFGNQVFYQRCTTKITLATPAEFVAFRVYVGQGPAGVDVTGVLPNDCSVVPTGFRTPVLEVQAGILREKWTAARPGVTLATS